jgi:hypothetical protein
MKPPKYLSISVVVKDEKNVSVVVFDNGVYVFLQSYLLRSARKEIRWHKEGGFMRVINR